jgi:hypothetical protein
MAERAMGEGEECPVKAALATRSAQHAPPKMDQGANASDSFITVPTTTASTPLLTRPAWSNSSGLPGSTGPAHANTTASPPVPASPPAPAPPTATRHQHQDQQLAHVATVRCSANRDQQTYHGRCKEATPRS